MKPTIKILSHKIVVNPDTTSEMVASVSVPMEPVEDMDSMDEEDLRLVLAMEFIEAFETYLGNTSMVDSDHHTPSAYSMLTDEEKENARGAFKDRVANLSKQLEN